MNEKDRDVTLTELPVGFEQFHKRRFINYQLNRAHALGYADTADLRTTARTVRSAADCVAAFDALARTAERDDRLRNATSYQRIAEFFTPPRSEDKIARYRKYRELFDAAFAATGIVRHDVPYASASLPAYLLPGIGGPAAGTVVLHGGFDSLIEEFFAIWQRIAAAGFDVLAFDGPGAVTIALVPRVGGDLFALYMVLTAFSLFAIGGGTMVILGIAAIGAAICALAMARLSTTYRT